MKLLYFIQIFNRDLPARIGAKFPNIINISDSFPSFTCDSKSELLDNFVEYTRNQKGLRFTSELKLTPKELDKIPLFRVGCRSMFREKDRDFEINRKLLKEVRRDKNCIIQTIKQITLTGLNIKTNQIVCDDALEEFYADISVVNLFKGAGFSGVSYEEIINGKTGKPYESHFRLLPQHVLNRICNDSFLKIDKKDSSKYAYKILRNPAVHQEKVHYDFQHTYEPLGPNDMPNLVISKNVFDFIRANKISGLRFKPMFLKNDKLYEKYLEIWNESYEKITENPNNDIW